MTRIGGEAEEWEIHVIPPPFSWGRAELVQARELFSGEVFIVFLRYRVSKRSMYSCVV